MRSCGQQQDVIGVVLASPWAADETPDNDGKLLVAQFD